MAKQVSWPGGARVAVCFDIRYLHWVGQPRGLRFGPSVAPEEGHEDLVSATFYEYADRAGIFHILEALTRQDVKATLGVSAAGIAAQQAVLRDYSEAGHEVALYGYSVDTPMYGRSEGDEREIIERSVKAYASAFNRQPSGWMSPNAQQGESTADLLHQAGFTYQADYADRDHPYVMNRPSGPLVALPFEMDLSDERIWLKGRNPPSAYVSTFNRNLAYLAAEGPGGPAGKVDGLPMMSAVFHVHLYGKPLGASALEECLASAKSTSGVWIATREEISNYFLKAMD